MQQSHLKRRSITASICDDSEVDRTIAFVDLAGFSALTESHGDEDAATLAERFTALATESLLPGERVVKSIGDAVMLEAPDPIAGVRLVARLCSRTDVETAFPVLRAGLHHGSVVQRGDDLFGATVNLASRVAAQAAGGQVLATSVIASAVEAIELTARSLGPVRLRNIAEPIDLFEISPCPSPHERVIDPVCRMAVDRATAPGRLAHQGRECWFCSLSCAAAFAKDPERFTAGSPLL